MSFVYALLAASCKQHAHYWSKCVGCPETGGLEQLKWTEADQNLHLQILFEFGCLNLFLRNKGLILLNMINNWTVCVQKYDRRMTAILSCSEYVTFIFLFPIFSCVITQSIFSLNKARVVLLIVRVRILIYSYSLLFHCQISEENQVLMSCSIAGVMRRWKSLNSKSI